MKKSTLLFILILSYVVGYPIYILVSIVAYVATNALYPLTLSFDVFLCSVVFIPLSPTLDGFINSTFITIFGFALLSDIFDIIRGYET